MPRGEFVQKMRATLGDQKLKEIAAQEEKQRIADIIEREGKNKWAELQEEARETAGDIGEGLTYVDTAEGEFTLRVDNRRVQAKFDPSKTTITYESGSKSGAFSPVVQGHRLEFVRQYKMPSGEIVIDEVSSGTLNPRDIAEILISEVVGNN